ncbi:MAG: sulfatase-like hydrolase/transferase [Acidobacteriota bacterium]
MRAALLAVLLCAPHCGGKLRARVPRDVVLITIDTLRADAVGFDGNTRGTTPHLDALAREGRVFSAAHGQNVLTLPSHTNILTGLYPYQHGVRENSGFRLNTKFETAATRLKQRGYATGAFVAAFPLDARYGLGRGFDVYDQLYRQVDQPQDFRIQESPADAVVAAALAWYRGAKGRPRLLWVHLYDPHAPYDPPPAERARFADDLYLGEVAFADAALAPLLDEVVRADPPPLVVVTGDHGEARGDHGELTHGLFAYEATLHVPLFLWCPPLADAGRDAGLARHIDVLPTVLDAVGAPADTGLPGRSLLSARNNPDETSYFESLSATLNRGWAPLRGLVGSGHKYIDLPIPELYDLSADPAEKKNLVAQAPDALRKLRREFERIPTGSSERSAVGAEEAVRLRSLGYLTGSGDAKTRYGAEDDPKNRIGVDRQLHEVVDAFQGGHLDESIRIARQIVTTNPTMRMGYQQLAFLLQERGDLPGALKCLDTAAATGAGGEATDRRRALLLSELGRPKDAVRVLTPYADSDDGETLNALGIALTDSGDPAAGLRIFSRVLEIDPGNALAYQNSGISLLKLQRASEARESLLKALAVSERNPRAWNALGVAWMELGGPEKALEAWSRAVSYDPSQFDALYNIGLVATRLGRRQQAIEALQKFVNTAPPARYRADIAEVRAALERLKKGP